MLRDNRSPPLSLVKITIVFCLKPRRSRAARARPTPWSARSSRDPRFEGLRGVEAFLPQSRDQLTRRRNVANRVDALARI